MKLACYADDSREPDLIGEADVDLTEVLTKGETDGEYASSWSGLVTNSCRVVHAHEQGQVCWKGLLGAHVLVERSSFVLTLRALVLIVLNRNPLQKRR